MASSEKRLVANRLNALRSTGPKTREGKAKVRRNRLRHGMRASDPVLPEEDAASFEMTLAEIRENLQPAWPMERILCRQIAEVTWRLMRVGRMEVRIFEKALEDESAQACDTSVDALARQLDRPDHALITLSRYEGGLRNTLSRLMGMYQRLRTVFGQSRPYAKRESAVQTQSDDRPEDRKPLGDNTLHAEIVESEIGFDRPIKANSESSDPSTGATPEPPLEMEVSRLDVAPDRNELEERAEAARAQVVIEATPTPDAGDRAGAPETTTDTQMPRLDASLFARDAAHANDVKSVENQAKSRDPGTFNIGPTRESPSNPASEHRPAGSGRSHREIRSALTPALSHENMGAGENAPRAIARPAGVTPGRGRPGVTEGEKTGGTGESLRKVAGDVRIVGLLDGESG